MDGTDGKNKPSLESLHNQIAQFKKDKDEASKNMKAEIAAKNAEALILKKEIETLN